MFEPSVIIAYYSAELVKWAAESSIDFINISGVPTHELKHVINFTFLNVAFISSLIQTYIYYGSDHKT